MEILKITTKTPVGDPVREAIAPLHGYVYQIYQSALAWIELEDDEILYLEVAEDFAKLAGGELEAVQVKKTNKSVTINSNEIITTINSFVELREKNKDLKVTLRHLTTSKIGKEQNPEHRIGDLPLLEDWRNLAKIGDLSDFRRILNNSKLSKNSKDFVNSLGDDEELRESFLKRIHFDCGAPDSHILEKQIELKVSDLLQQRDGVHSQTSTCVANLVYKLLELSTKTDVNKRFVDRNLLETILEKVTKIPLSRNVIESLIQSKSDSLQANLPAETNLPQTHLFCPIPISELPLPKVFASRENDILQLQQILESVNLCWITGSAGMGKKFTSRILAHKNTGDWARINLQGKSIEQISAILVQAANSLKGFVLRGLIINDLSRVNEPTVLESLHFLVHSANRSDVLLVINSTETPASEFRFASNLQIDFTRTLSSFTKEDIQEILANYEVDNLENWTNYIYNVCGGGHPQLTMTFIQRMAATDWNIDELLTHDDFIFNPPAVSEARKHTRQRLWSEMASEKRRLIGRLSLKSGGFSRELTLDLAKVEPQISDAGIILDSLIGSWIDQLERDRFDLSPLLADFANMTLNTSDKVEIHRTIANSLTKNYNLDVIDMNSALLSALRSNNETAIVKLCMGILNSSSSDLKKIAPYLPAFRFLSADSAYPSNASINHMLRGTQILLASIESNSQEKLKDILRCFSEEAKELYSDAFGATLTTLVYSKMLLQTSNPGLGISFLSVISELNQLLENENGVLPPKVIDEMKKFDKDGLTAIGIMFINQAKQLSKIEELPSVFDFLENSTYELRERLLAPLSHNGLEVDILVAGAWLNEYRENTIDPELHSNVFKCLEKLAHSWNHTDLAVCCRKFRAIIIDEYGNDKTKALTVLDEALSNYGQTNSELVRAKAKVLHRSDDHEGSLVLAKKLIDGDIPLNEVEKAFLGREAAISAEKQGDYKTARRYYLYGSTAALNTKLDSMKAMHVGLMADAALASWHNGDRQTCLDDFLRILDVLNNIKPDQTLRNAHCHALVRQALLWLELEITGVNFQFKDGTRLKIYPGCVSNPEPHPKIKEQLLLPMDMAWYKLAAVENYALLNLGITENLKFYLPCGPVLEGQILLCQPKMHKALSQLDIKLFIEALQEIISFSAFAIVKQLGSTGIDFTKVTYDTLPKATKDQQQNLQDRAEQFVLLYCAVCIFKDSITSIPLALEKLTEVEGFFIRPELIDHIQRNGPSKDYYTGLANLILKGTKGNSPRDVFELAFYILQVAKQTDHYRLVVGILHPWLLERCLYILENQRFRLNLLQLHEAEIRIALEQNDLSTETKVVKILTAILPTLGIPNQHVISNILSELSK